MTVAERNFLDTLKLSQDQLTELEGLRRSERLEQIADWENNNLSEMVDRLGDETGMAVVSHEHFDLI